jgi:hypothetical protein
MLHAFIITFFIFINYCIKIQNKLLT